MDEREDDTDEGETDEGEEVSQASEADEETNNDEEMEEESEEEEEDTVLRKISDDVVRSMKFQVKRHVETLQHRRGSDVFDNDEEEDDEPDEGRDKALSVFNESEDEFMKRFHQRYWDYASVFPMWGKDEFVKAIHLHKEEKGPIFAENEALHTALDEHKYVIHTSLLKAIDRFLESNAGSDKQ